MAKCKKCGAEHLHNEHLHNDPCPACGELPGTSETITDLPRIDFKAARKKLKEEIAEGIEEDKKRL